MKNISRSEHGAAAAEFALVVVPVIVFVLGIIQAGYIVWVDNLLQLSVNTAARCGAVGSTTAPCAGSNMVSAATTAFLPLTGAAFTTNDCAGSGLVGTYSITLLFAVDLTLTAQSCYPNVSS